MPVLRLLRVLDIMTSEGQSRSLVEAMEIIYLTHGCSCDEHPTNGSTASCKAWRRRAAEQVAAALLPPDKGGMALRPCPRCEALIRAEQHMCWDCALRETAS